MGMFLVCIVIAGVLLIFARGLLGTISSFITTPFYFVRHYIETSSATVPIFLRSRIELSDQIRALQTDISAQRGLSTTLEYVMQENQELRDLLQASTTPRIAAGVIARPPYTPYDTMIIDKGTSDGILAYAPVYYGKGNAIGYVRTVFEHNALITLFSSPGVESTVYVFGPNIFATAYGEGGGIIRISIPQGIVVNEGNIVVLPSLDAGVIGKVDHVQSIATEPEQHAYVAFDIPMQSVRLVSVGSTPVKAVTFTDAEAEIQDVERQLFTIVVPPDLRLTAGTTSTTTNAVGTTSTARSTPPL